MPRPRRIAATAIIGSGATLSGFYGFLIGEAMLARRVIGTTDARPPSPDGIYGEDLPGRTVRLLVLGDSAAVGYGVTRSDATPSGMLAIGLAHVLGAQVDVKCRAVVGAQTSDLMAQIDSIDELDDWEPHVAVIIVGANDVTHQVPPRTSARLLAEATRRLVAADCEVVVGTTPDLGTVKPIPQPLRAVARAWSRHLARRQTVALVEAGGRAVSLGGLLGKVFDEKRDIMFGADRFHPSEAGYASMVSVLVPAVVASLREKQRTAAYAGYVSGEAPRDLMTVHEAAAEAAQHEGTQVVQDEQHGGGRWATVLRRRRAG